MGALSLVNLVRDLSRLQLYGLLKESSDAYSLLVQTITEVAFGWLQWRLLSITTSEGHVLTLASHWTAAAIRNERRWEGDGFGRAQTKMPFEIRHALMRNELKSHQAEVISENLVWWNGKWKRRRSVCAVSMARSEYFRCPPPRADVCRLPSGDGLRGHPYGDVASPDERMIGGGRVRDSTSSCTSDDARLHPFAVIVPQRIERISVSGRQGRRMCAQRLNAVPPLELS